GFRIELGEVEAALARLPEVADAVAVAESDLAGGRSIRAYAVVRESTPPASAASLRRALQSELPAFMVPDAIELVAALPRSSNGKVDRRALAAKHSQSGSVAAADGPRGPTEQRLAAILEPMLGGAPIARDADLFGLGFHSLLALRLLARIEREFGVELELRSLFARSTLAALAESIDEHAARRSAPEGERPFQIVNQSGRQAPFVFLHGDLFAGGIYSRRLAAAIGPDQPLIAVASHGTAGLPMLPTIEEMARDYAPRLREVQPHGPYRLGGFCSSGVIAYELARVLRAQGEVVERLVLLNASPMPSRSLPVFDALLRFVALNAALDPYRRERLCYRISRLHAALVHDPRALLVLAREWRARKARSGGLPTTHEPQPFPKRRGARETENSLAHFAAALTYHPKPYDGDVALVWSSDQRSMFNDRTVGWGALVRDVQVVEIGGGHVAALNERIDEVARAISRVLG
ncbi:MAG: thioesterase domain-containing protein, partial [Vulcanimicrobiaceae bacterium]